MPPKHHFSVRFLQWFDYRSDSYHVQSDGCKYHIASNIHLYRPIWAKVIDRDTCKHPNCQMTHCDTCLLKRMFASVPFHTEMLQPFLKPSTMLSNHHFSQSPVGMFTSIPMYHFPELSIPLDITRAM